MSLSLLGIHVEVRHLTFVTGQLVYAGMQRGAEGVVQSDFLWALTSIAEVGLINFAVSFALALSVAFRAKLVKSSEQVKLLFAVFRRFNATPMEFFIAPKVTRES
jgi:site-specific recombinase